MPAANIRFLLSQSQSEDVFEVKSGLWRSVAHARTQGREGQTDTRRPSWTPDKHRVRCVDRINKSSISFFKTPLDHSQSYPLH